MAVAGVLFLIVSTAMAYYQIPIDGKMAVSQLSESYSSSANVKMWESLKKSWMFGYTLLVILLFIPEIGRLFKNK